MEIMAEIREILVKNAIDCTFYVACGKSLRRELAEKHGLTEDHVQGLLSKEACLLVDQIKKLK